MENKVNYIHAINFVNLFHTRRDKVNSKTQFLPMYFDG